LVQSLDSKMFVTEGEWVATEHVCSHLQRFWGQVPIVSYIFVFSICFLLKLVQSLDSKMFVTEGGWVATEHVCSCL